MHHLHPLLIHELGRDFDLDRVLAHGTLPGIYAESDPEVRAADPRAYTDIYLREEIQAEALVRNVGGYARLLEHVAVASGRILNINALLHRHLDRPQVDEREVLLEQLVAHELYRRLGTLWPEMKLHHYPTRHGLEVDFVLEIQGEIWGLEVKASRDVSDRALSTLKAFADRVPGVKRQVVVFLGERKQKRDSVEVLPLRKFLDELPR